MIKANELRIGNLVCAQNGELMKIKNIQDNSINLLIDGDGVAGSYKLNEFNGVEITHDILDSCGFNRDKIYKYRRELGTFALHFTLYDYHKSETAGNRCWQLALDHGEYLTTKIQYLHQLQNLYFALTGEELEITL